MKVHILVISSASGHRRTDEEPAPFLSLKKARKALKQACHEAIYEGWYGDNWYKEVTPDSFLATANPNNPEVDYYSAGIITKKITI